MSRSVAAALEADKPVVQSGARLGPAGRRFTRERSPSLLQFGRAHVAVELLPDVGDDGPVGVRQCLAVDAGTADPDRAVGLTLSGASVLARDAPAAAHRRSRVSTMFCRPGRGRNLFGNESRVPRPITTVAPPVSSRECFDPWAGARAIRRPIRSRRWLPAPDETDAHSATSRCSAGAPATSAAVTVTAAASSTTGPVLVLTTDSCSVAPSRLCTSTAASAR